MQAASAAPAGIDGKIFQDLREMIDDDELFRELIVDFVEGSADLIQTFEQSALKGHLEESTRAAHSLKSTSATFGGQKMRELAVQAEDEVLRLESAANIGGLAESLRLERLRLCRYLLEAA